MNTRLKVKHLWVDIGTLNDSDTNTISGSLGLLKKQRSWKQPIATVLTGTVCVAKAGKQTSYPENI